MLDKSIIRITLTLLLIISKVYSQCSISNRRYIENAYVSQVPTYLTSPGWKTAYYSNTDCQWVLSTTSGKKIIVDVMESYMEGSPGCSYDYLGIYDAASLLPSAATKLCNNMRAGQLFVSTGENVILRLKSDFSVNYPGFYLRYFIGEDLSGSCGTVSLMANSTLQYLTSPGFPTEYDIAQECTWTITSSSSKSIRIEIILSDMMDGEVCYSDHLYIYEGSDDTGTLLADICDSSETFTDSVEYTTNNTDSVFIKFVTRVHGRSRRGFLLSYNETDTVVVTQTTTPSSTYSTCSPSPISLTATTSPIYITTPGYPIFYSANLNCQWLITASQESIIQIKVIDFYLEDSEACFGDRVTVYDGSTTSYPQILQNCGEISNDVNTTGHVALIVFRSDGSTAARGFKYEITSLSGGTPVCVSGNPMNLTATIDRQYFSSDNFPSNYGNSLTEQWLIFNSLSYDYEIVIETVESTIENSVNCYADKVQIYQGPCTSYPVLGTFCGQSTPTYVQSNGLYVLIKFSTDDSVNYRGFNISYYLREVTTSGLTTTEMVAIIVGIVVSLVVLGIIIFVVYKAVRASSSAKVKHGSKSSLSSRSSSSSSSSSSDDERRIRNIRRKLRPITSRKYRLLPSSKFQVKQKLPSIEVK